MTAADEHIGIAPFLALGVHGGQAFGIAYQKRGHRRVHWPKRINERAEKNPPEAGFFQSLPKNYLATDFLAGFLLCFFFAMVFFRSEKIKTSVIQFTFTCRHL